MKLKSIIILFVFVLFLVPSLKASQEIVETRILSGFLNETYKQIKKVLRISHNMQYEAQPFTRKRHRERFRFSPKQTNPRDVISTSRRVSATFKIINGLLSHTNIPNKKPLFEEIFESTDSLNTYGKRAIRAIRDNNYALYLASANGIEKEIFNLNSLLDDLESVINSTISESDAIKENL